MAAFDVFAWRSDIAAPAWEGDRLVGCVCLGAFHHFISSLDWVLVKVELTRSGIKLAMVGCTVFVY